LLREFADMLSMGHESRFGLLPRAFSIIFILAYSAFFVEATSLATAASALGAELAAIMAVLWVDGRLRKFIGGFKVVALFVLLGGAFYAFSLVTGIGPSSLVQAAVGVVKTTMLAVPLILAVSWFSPREVSFIAKKLGAERASLLLRVAFSLLPILFVEMSNSFFTIKLKYGSRRLYKGVHYVILQSFFLGRSFYEAYYQFGLPELSVPLLRGSRAEIVALALLGCSLALSAAAIAVALGGC